MGLLVREALPVVLLGLKGLPRAGSRRRLLEGDRVITSGVEEESLRPFGLSERLG